MLMFHNELHQRRMEIRRLSAQYFFMNYNLSLARDEKGDNIHKWPLDQLVDMEGFQLDLTTGYHYKHDMIEIIASAHHIEGCNLSLCIGFSEKFTFHGRYANYLDHDLDIYFWV